MLILQLLVFALPVVVSAILHMVAVKLNWFPQLKIPIDAGKFYRDKRVFGDSKTWRGVILMVVFSILSTYMYAWICSVSDSFNQFNILRFQMYSPAFYGLLYGLGYTLAELPNSFLKRQKGVQEGKSLSLGQIIIDQIDSPLGCLLLLAPFTDMTLTFFISGLFFYLLLHLFFNYLLYLLKLRKNPL